MKAKHLKQARNKRRKVGIRKKVVGDPQKPRLTVYRSLKHIYAQLVDDLSGQTLASASTASAKIQSGGNVEAAKAVGKDLAAKAASAGIGAVTFDRNGYRYHGRIKALADSAREAGLKF